MEEQDKHEALRRQKAPPAGNRPGVLKDSEPQGRMGQHCGVGYELVQALAVPVLQMVEQHVEVLSFLRSSLPAVAEQVIEVPALSLPVCAVQRVVPLEPQMAEQSVEVPTVLSVAVLVVVVVFKVLSQNRVQQHLVPCRSLTSPFVEAFTVLSQDRIQQRPVSSRSLTFLLEANKIFTSVRAQQLHPLALRMILQVGFSTFPRDKKSVRVAASPSARAPRHVSSWTPAAYGETIGSVEWVSVSEGGKTHYWNRRSNETFWNPPEGTKVVWIGEKSADGGIWYWHRDTRVLPPLPPG